MPTQFELIAYAIINYIPYILLSLLPFYTDFRYSRTKTAVLVTGFSALILFIFVHGYHMGDTYHLASNHLITLLSLSFYFTCVKSRWGRMLFHLFMVKNTANFVVVVAKCLEGKWFPDSVGTLYHWSNSLCMLLVTVLLAPIVTYIVLKYFTKEIRDTIDPTLWRFLWLIPVFFYIIWQFVFYHFTDESSLKLALKPSSAVFMAWFLFGQYLIYICIAKLVIYFNKTTYLQEENLRLTEQEQQYRQIQDHIREISKMKHDLRHHLLTLSHYADHEEYDALKQYLHEYIDTVPKHTISYCENTALNLLLVYYAQKCQDASISFTVDLHIPNATQLSDSEITVLFGNLLENAFDACMAMPDKAERALSFNGKFLHKQFVFVLENTYANPFLTEEDGSVLSTKHDGYGIGTASARSIVESHSGTIQFSPMENTFSVSLLLPLDYKA